MQSKLELKNIPFQSNRCTLALQMTCFKLLLLKRMVSISSLCHTFNSFATPRRVPAKCLQRRQHVPPKVQVNAATYQRPNQLQEGLENIIFSQMARDCQEVIARSKVLCDWDFSDQFPSDYQQPPESAHSMDTE